MDQHQKREAALDSWKKLLATQIKLDIASELRHHPHLEGASYDRAWAQLASDENVEQLVSDMAREEVEAAIARGELPAASFLRLAGYRINPLPEG